jgi:hypothetical protein
MRRSTTGLIGGLLCTVALAAALVIAGSLEGGGSAARAAGVSAAPADPAAELPTSGCIPVAAHDGSGGSAGCVLATDVYATPPVYDRQMARLGGLPVYADASTSKQLGLLAGELGFVPQALVGRLPALRVCHDQLLAFLAAPKDVVLTPECTSLLSADGYPSAFLADGKVSSLDTTTAAN